MCRTLTFSTTTNVTFLSREPKFVFLCHVFAMKANCATQSHGNCNCFTPCLFFTWQRCSLSTLLSSTMAPLSNAQCSERQCLIASTKGPQGDSACSGRRQITRGHVIRGIKYSYSLVLLTFCLSMILAGIMANETPVAMETRPLVAVVAMCLLIFWLGILEGGQGSLVGLQPIDPEAYRESHPSAYQCTTMVYKGDNLNRFIVGRQFLVVLVVFCMNLCCTVVEDALVPGFNKDTVEIFLASGLAVMLITVILGQLSAEVNATNCMLDFIDTPLMVATTWVCLAVEASGLLHATYLVQCCFSIFTDESSSSSSADDQTTQSRTLGNRICFWIRVGISSLLLAGAFAVTWSALLNNQTTMYKGLSKTASVAIFFGLTCFLGVLEAMQIAVFAVVKLPENKLTNYPTAQTNCQLVFKGCNFKAFLIGRQICVTTCMFLLARITTTDVDPTVKGETVLGVSDGIQDFFNTGLPGALITTIVASLIWRIMASSFPIPFLANPVVRFTIQFCLVLEASGIFSAAWLLADLVKFVMQFRPDDVYLPKKDVFASSRSWDTESTFNEEGELDEEEGSGSFLEIEEPIATTYGTTSH